MLLSAAALLAVVTPPTATVPAWIFACGLIFCAAAVVVLLGMRRRGE